MVSDAQATYNAAKEAEIMGCQSTQGDLRKLRNPGGRRKGTSSDQEPLLQTPESSRRTNSGHFPPASDPINIPSQNSQGSSSKQTRVRPKISTFDGTGQESSSTAPLPCVRTTLNIQRSKGSASGPERTSRESNTFDRAARKSPRGSNMPGCPSRPHPARQTSQGNCRLQDYRQDDNTLDGAGSDTGSWETLQRYDGTGDSSSESSSISGDPSFDAHRNSIPSQFRPIWSSKYVLLSAIICAFSGFLFGCDQGVLSVLLVKDRFILEFPRIGVHHSKHELWKGLLTAIIVLGAFLGSLAQGFVDKASTKWSFLLASFTFLFGSTLQAGAHGYAMFVVARLVEGFGIGMLSVVAFMHISEISTPGTRGTLVILVELSVVLGVCVGFWIAFATGHIPSGYSWKLPFILQSIPAMTLTLLVKFLPYSPRWLCSRGLEDQALDSLSILRELPKDSILLQQEWNEIRFEVQYNNEICNLRYPHRQRRTIMKTIRNGLDTFYDCFRRGCIKRTHVGMVLMAFQQFLGITAITYYSPTLFQQMGVHGEKQLLISGALNACQLIGGISSLWTVVRFRRLSLLTSGSLCIAISQISIAGLIALFSSNWTLDQTVGWKGIVILFFYILAFGASWGPVPSVITSEIFPSSTRAKGEALSIGAYWLSNFLVVLTTPLLAKAANWAPYAFYGFFSLASMIWVSQVVPETRNIPLEQMESIFEDASQEQEDGDEEIRDRVRKFLGDNQDPSRYESAE